MHLIMSNKKKKVWIVSANHPPQTCHESRSISHTILSCKYLKASKLQDINKNGYCDLIQTKGSMSPLIDRIHNRRNIRHSFSIH